MTPRSNGNKRSEEVLRALFVHRAMTVEQLRRLCDCSPVTVRDILRKHARDGLTRCAPLDSWHKVWFLTSAGIAQVERNRLVAHVRGALAPKAIRGRGGPFTVHHLAVTDAGLAFVEAARQRGDLVEFTHEVCHGIATGTMKEFLVSDAFVQYEMHRNGETTFMRRYLEIDRAVATRTGTSPLISKLLAYAKLQAHKEVWSMHAAKFPRLIVVMAGDKDDREKRLERIRTVARALELDHRARDYEPAPTTFCLLEDLEDRGPFEPIFYTPTGGGRVDVLGQAA
jgi:hypothetical protein